MTADPDSSVIVRSSICSSGMLPIGGERAVEPHRSPGGRDDQRRWVPGGRRSHATGRWIDDERGGHVVDGLGAAGTDVEGPKERGRPRCADPSEGSDTLGRRPIATAASTSWPTTSPTITPTWPSGQRNVSYQSPPTSSATSLASYPRLCRVSDVDHGVRQ